MKKPYFPQKQARIRTRTLATSALSLLLLVGCGQNSMFSQNRTFAIWNETIQTEEIQESSNEVLLVVDNSKSMDEEIVSLRSSLDGFVNTLNSSGMKYRLHFVSMSQGYRSISDSAPDQMCFNSLFPNQLCLNGTPAVETATFPNPILYRLQQLQTYSFDNEPGFAVAASALDAIFNRHNGGNVQPTHVVVLSDEDNQSAVEGRNLEIEGGRTDYTYQYSRATDYWKSFPTNTFCLRSPNSHETKAGNFAQQYYCSDPGGFGGHGDPGKESTHFACEAPRNYRCSEVADGLTISVLSSDFHAGCALDSAEPTVRRLVPKDAVWPGVSNCQALTCELEWEIPFSISQSGNDVTVTDEGCRAGFDYAQGTFEREVGRVTPNGRVVGGLPAGVTLKHNYLRVNETFTSPEWLTLAQAKAQILADHPKFPHELNIYDYPATAMDLVEAIPAQSEGLKAFVEKRYPSLKFTFNAIVSQNDGRCPGNDHDNVRGTQYLALAAQTGGIQGDICNPNFDEFMQLLADNVVKQNLASYKLKGYVMPGTYVEIINENTGRVLRQNVDFEILNGQYVRFAEGVITSSNQILSVMVKAIHQ